MVCAADGKEVPPDEIVKGYEVAPDQYVVVDDKEMEELAPKESRTIEIRDFVSLADIDPIYYDRPYYVAPADRAAKPYRLLVEAMEKSGRVGIATFVMRTKEYLAALRPLKGAICLETMRFAEEVVPVSEVEAPTGSTAKADTRELKMAQQLIDSLSTDFNPSRYKDEFKERVMAMVEAKAEGDEVVTPPPAAEDEHRGKVINLVSALEESLARAKAASKSAAKGGGSPPKRRKSA
jgi:DNA end-binding protein Ku